VAAVLFVLLQNTWHSQPRLRARQIRLFGLEFWEESMWRGQTGRRLKIAIEGVSPVVVRNASPKVGSEASSVFPPDFKYVARQLAECQPTAVLACGAQAEFAAVPLWPGPLLCIPHPAYRVLTTELLVRANSILRAGLSGRIALRQRRWGVEPVDMLVEN
jgi:hypothetical protein